jgi:hypothetical protein
LAPDPFDASRTTPRSSAEAMGKTEGAMGGRGIVVIVDMVKAP